MEKGLKFLDSNNEDNQNFEESSINSLGNSNLLKNISVCFGLPKENNLDRVRKNSRFSG